MKSLHIHKSVLGRIYARAKAADTRECLGLLAKRPDADAVSSATLLPGLASQSSAEAEPIAVKRAADNVLAQGLVPVGLWHSHGRHAVFHSGTDHETIRRLMPAMASWNYQRPCARLGVPMVVGPDSAILPSADGYEWKFTLQGELITGSEAHLRVAWADVTTRFNPARQQPQARLEHDRLVLEGGETTLTLRLPAGSTLNLCRQDAAPYKVACLFSLVVNSRGEDCADCITIHNCDGGLVLEQRPCELICVDDGETEVVIQSVANSESEPGNGHAEAGTGFSKLRALLPNWSRT